MQGSTYHRRIGEIQVGVDSLTEYRLVNSNLKSAVFLRSAVWPICVTAYASNSSRTSNSSVSIHLRLRQIRSIPGMLCALAWMGRNEDSLLRAAGDNARASATRVVPAPTRI